MAVYGTNNLTMADWAKRMDPDGSPAAVVEILNETNQVLDDMVWMEGNLPTGHRTTIRTGLPEVYFRLINQAVSTSKGKTEQVDEACAMMEAWSEVDVELADLNGNTASFRAAEARPFLEAMSQKHALTLFYGNQDNDPEQFTGLSPRYSSLSAANAENIINCDASPDAGVTSIWVVTWGENTCFGMFPKGSQVGLRHLNHGAVTVDGASGDYGSAGQRIRVYQDQFIWKCGLVLKDWRFVARAANIDVSSLDTFSGAADISAALVKCLHAIPSPDMGRTAIYMNRTVMQALDLQGLFSVRGHSSPVSGDVDNAYGTPYGAGSYANWQGRPVTEFRGLPVKRVDAILTSEDTVS